MDGRQARGDRGAASLGAGGRDLVLLFDWFHRPDAGSGPINMAFDTYWKLPDNAGVGAAIAYVNQDPFVIPPGEWAQVVENWVTRYFVRPSYARIAGRPLLMILDEAGFIRQWGGRAVPTPRSPSFARPLAATVSPACSWSAAAISTGIASSATRIAS